MESGIYAYQANFLHKYFFSECLFLSHFRSKTDELVSPTALDLCCHDSCSIFSRLTCILSEGKHNARKTSGGADDRRV
jgi:hypothetical protein